MNFTSIFKNGTVLWKTDLKFLKRLNIELKDLTIRLLSIDPKELKSSEISTCTGMLKTAQFTIAKRQE